MYHLSHYLSLYFSFLSSSIPLSLSFYIFLSLFFSFSLSLPLPLPSPTSQFVIIGHFIQVFWNLLPRTRAFRRYMVMCQHRNSSWESLFNFFFSTGFRVRIVLTSSYLVWNLFRVFFFISWREKEGQEGTEGSSLWF